MNKFSTANLPVTLHQTRLGYLQGYGVSVILIFLPIIALAVAAPDFIRLISYGPALVGIVSLALLEVKIRMYKVTIEKTKIRLHKGILSREHSSASFDKITDFRVYQSLFQHLLGYGTIFVNTAAGDQYELFIEKIRNPHSVQEFLTELEHELRLGFKTPSQELNAQSIQNTEK